MDKRRNWREQEKILWSWKNAKNLFETKNEKQRYSGKSSSFPFVNQRSFLITEEDNIKLDAPFSILIS